MATRRLDDRTHMERILGTVGDAMTATVVYVTPDMELGTAARLLERSGVSGAPVVEEGGVVGVVTIQDIFGRLPLPGTQIETSGPFHRWERALNELSRRTATLVRDVCSYRALTVEAGTPLAAAASLMAAGRINRLPVVDANGALCGVVARDDVVRAVAEAYDRAAVRETENLAAAGAAHRSF
jgi:CBS domain-containing protein